MNISTVPTAGQHPASGLALATPETITNVVALFEALAVGWVEGSTRNRYLLAGERVQFVRGDTRHHTRTYPPKCEPDKGDIPVVVLNHGYSMRGFIQHETRILYRGMFHTSYDDEDGWWSAQLTAQGFKFAQAPVFDVASFHRDIAACSFFNPPTKAPASPALGGPSVAVRLNVNLPNGRFLGNDLP